MNGFKSITGSPWVTNEDGWSHKLDRYFSKNPINLDSIDKFIEFLKINCQVVNSN